MYTLLGKECTTLISNAFPVRTNPASAGGILPGTIALGMQLATMLQTYIELAREAKEELHTIVADVNGTSAALKQLQLIVDADRDASDPATTVFKGDRVHEIERLARSSAAPSTRTSSC